MKKLIAFLLSLALMTGAFLACASAESQVQTSTDLQPVKENSGSTTTEEAIDANWVLPETIEMTSTVTEVFDQAMEGLVGVHYEPLGYLGEKDGTYCILCRATVVYPGAKPFYALVYVNENGLQNIWDIWMDKHANP
jgi:hypothetical protein